MSMDAYEKLVIDEKNRHLSQVKAQVAHQWECISQLRREHADCLLRAANLEHDLRCQEEGLKRFLELRDALESDIDELLREVEA